MRFSDNLCKHKFQSFVFLNETYYRIYHKYEDRFFEFGPKRSGIFKTYTEVLFIQVQVHFQTLGNQIIKSGILLICELLLAL